MEATIEMKENDFNKKVITEAVMKKVIIQNILKRMEKMKLIMKMNIK